MTIGYTKKEIQVLESIKDLLISKNLNTKEVDETIIELRKEID